MSEAAKLDPAVQSALELAGLEHEVIACDPDFADTAAFCEHYGYTLQQSANTILVAAKKEPDKCAVCVVLAGTRLDVNKKVCELLGVRKASFAAPEQTTELTGMMIGGVTPFGLPDSLPLYIDVQVDAEPSVIVGGGNRSSKVKLAGAELKKLPRAQVIEGLAKRPEG